MSQPLISLVVLGYRNFNTVTKPCLESLLTALPNPAVESLVVDNASPDESAALTAQWCAQHPAVRCLLSTHNRGFAGGMNWGAEHATGQWLVLVNNDTIFPSSAVRALETVLARAPADVAMVAPVTNAAGNGQRLWKPGASHAEWLEIAEQLHADPTGLLLPTYRCDFFCVAIRRDVWQALGGLDTDFGLGYYEDFEFSLRVRKAGYQQMITEDVFVLHTGSATFQGDAKARALIKHNKKLLQTKHPDARFEHTRLGNLVVLQTYQSWEAQGLWSAALAKRRALRQAALQQDAPRSWLKKWLWQRRVKSLLT